MEEVKARAEADGAFDGKGTEVGKLMAVIDRISSMPEGEPLRRLVEPYVVRVTTSNPYSVATLMQLDNWFRPVRQCPSDFLPHRLQLTVFQTALLSSIFTRCFNEISDSARIRTPANKARYVNGRRQAVQETVGDVLRSDQSIVLDAQMLYAIVDPVHHDQLEGHLINFFMASNRLDDLSHERSSRRGLGNGFQTQIRVSDTRARLEAESILRIPARL